MRLTENRLRRIIKNVIRENMDDMMDPMMSMDPMNCEECQILCDKREYLQSKLAAEGCEDVESAREFFALLARFRSEVFEGPTSWQENEKRIKQEYPTDSMIVADLYHMCVDEHDLMSMFK